MEKMISKAAALAIVAQARPSRPLARHASARTPGDGSPQIAAPARRNAGQAAGLARPRASGFHRPAAIAPRDDARPDRDLPRAERDGLQAESLAFPAGLAPRLLVVEDQPMNQKVLQHQLEHLGVDCGLARNGQEALDLLADNRYDIIITDCSMPVMDGLELTRRLRALEAAGRPRSAIIAVTANTDSARLCYEAGADAYLPKPLTLAGLRETLTQWHLEGMPLAPEDDGNARPATCGGDDAGEPIDRDALARILGDSGPDLIDRVMRDFLGSWQDSLAAIGRELKRQDPAAMAEVAHAAKGTAQYGAAAQLAADCARLEKLVRAERWPEAAATVERLRIETHRLQIYLTRLGVIGYEQFRST
jgi:CheY-like chemotaxis protein/HPt (histidine-containing phosphotransfer) domain-containing protein